MKKQYWDKFEKYILNKIIHKKKLIWLMDKVVKKHDNTHNAENLFDARYLFSYWVYLIAEFKYLIFIISSLNNIGNKKVIESLVWFLLNEIPGIDNNAYNLDDIVLKVHPRFERTFN